MDGGNNVVVYVIDDDASVRKSLDRLMRAAGYQTETYSSAQEFLSLDPPDRPGCMILDIKMPGITGLELQERLASLNRRTPIIFITGHGSIPASVQAMKAGAVEFLEKPFDDKTLLDAISHAIEKDLQNRRKNDEMVTSRKRLKTLTPREREVFDLVARGLLNKQAAYQLGVTEKTIKVHRAHIMAKLKVKSFADLVRLAERLK